MNLNLPCRLEAEGKVTSLLNQPRASQHSPTAGHTQQVCMFFAYSKAFITAPARGTVSVPICRGGTEAQRARLLESMDSLTKHYFQPALAR